jgi:hypothetical protein
MDCDDGIFVFLHLPKTGGSTLAGLIRRQYPPDALRPAGNMFKTPDAIAPTLRELGGAGARATYGHFSFGFRRWLPPDAQLVTLLREPLERTLSHYYYVQRGADSSALAGRSIERTLRDGGTIADNLQTRMLSSRIDITAGDAADLYTEAADNLRRGFAVVGLTEHFDESLLLIARRAGWRHVVYDRKRVNAGRPRLRDLDEDAAAALRRYNEVDLALYDLARELFEERRGASDERWLSSALRQLRTAQQEAAEPAGHTTGSAAAPRTSSDSARSKSSG